ncbi:MAG TPA: T9SS type A sorting domain-containing protein [Bacteroidia bacterium]|jgi:hypothetical protein|nr:T9SS type A sorting domain-containing protein [Bacteroidia bacterium]
MKKLLLSILGTITFFYAAAQPSNKALSLTEKLSGETVATPVANPGEDEYKIQIYPNPTSDLLNISFNSESQSNVTIEIIDMTGKKVFSEISVVQIGSNVRSVFTNRFKSGIYFVKIQSVKGETVERFVKN